LKVKSIEMNHLQSVSRTWNCYCRKVLCHFKWPSKNGWQPYRL